LSLTPRLARAIPGGAHTYSRGADQFPANAPSILSRGKGCRIYDADQRPLLDYGMGLRSVTLGYAHDEVDEAAIRQLRNGNNLPRPSLIELEAAELLIGMIDSVDMVKFTKNGSTATTAAVKLARAFTGRDVVLRCLQHPFFSYDDWFIGSTVMARGVPQAIRDLTDTFDYNSIESLDAALARHRGRVACVIIEPMSFECPQFSGGAPAPAGFCACAAPCQRRGCGPGAGTNFLQQVEAACRREGALFVLDEMITGFRWHLKGAQHVYGVRPDISTFGKAMANGYSVACVAGRREVMDLGSIETPGQERTFLLSTTHGGEMSSLGAFVKTMDILARDRVVEHLWTYGNDLIAALRARAQAAGLARYIDFVGAPASPNFVTLDAQGRVSAELRTLLVQEMIKHGVFMPWLAFSHAHRHEHVEETATAFAAALPVYARALESGCGGLLEGPAVKPVFRRYN
jgi:glutamate-1-semialdehyde 2,1-aminomutase